MKNLFPFSKLPLCPIGSVCCLSERLSFTGFQLLIADLDACSIGILFRKSSPVPMNSRSFPTISSVSISVSGFMLRSSTHLMLSFVQDDSFGSIWILIHASIQFEQHHLLKMLSFFFPICVFGFFIKSQVSICVWI